MLSSAMPMPACSQEASGTATVAQSAVKESKVAQDLHHLSLLFAPQPSGRASPTPAGAGHVREPFGQVAAAKSCTERDRSERSSISHPCDQYFGEPEIARDPTRPRYTDPLDDAGMTHGKKIRVSRVPVLFG